MTQSSLDPRDCRLKRHPPTLSTACREAIFWFREIKHQGPNTLLFTVKPTGLETPAELPKGQRLVHTASLLLCSASNQVHSRRDARQVLFSAKALCPQGFVLNPLISGVDLDTCLFLSLSTVAFFKAFTTSRQL